MLRMHKSTDVDYHPKFYLEPVEAQSLHTSSSFPPFYHRNGSDDKHTSQLGTAILPVPNFHQKLHQKSYNHHHPKQQFQSPQIYSHQFRLMWMFHQS